MPSLEELVQRFLLFFKEVFNIELPCHSFNRSLPSFLLNSPTTILFSMTKLEKSNVDSHAGDRGNIMTDGTVSVSVYYSVRARLHYTEAVLR